MKTVILWAIKKLIDWDEIVEKLNNILRDKVKETDNTWDDAAAAKFEENKPLIVKILKTIL